MELKIQILNNLVRYIPKRIKRKILEEYDVLPYGIISFSQEGEDLIIARFFEGKKDGFYIDIGAHHPVRYSNTYKLYKKGWRGINIDATPGSMDAFRVLRKGDVNIEAVIDDKKQEHFLFVFDDPALNTISKETAEAIERNTKFKIIEKVPVVTTTINEILNDNMEADQYVDLISIDIEGLDYKIISSLDFTKYNPVLILFEFKDFEMSKDQWIVEDMCRKGYDFFAKTVNSLFFRKSSPSI